MSDPRESGALKKGSERVTDSPENGHRREMPDIVLYTPDETNTSVFDILLILIRNGRMIAVAMVIAGLIGLVAALLPDEQEYTATASVIREGQEESGGSPIMGLDRLGLNFGSSRSGMTVAVYPEVLLSREVLFAVVRDTFFTNKLGRRAQLVEYFAKAPSRWERITAGAETYLAGLFDSNGSRQVDQTQAASPPPAPEISDAGRFDVSQASPDEERAMSRVRKLVSTSIQSQTGLMEISATTPEPTLSVDVIHSFLRHFQERVKQIQTQKAAENLEFVQSRWEQAAIELEDAEEELAAFLQRNQSLQSARLLTQRERLQRKVDFKASLYSELQTQLTRAELNLQSSNPVVTVLEKPAMPSRSSTSNPLFIVFVSILFGAVIGGVLAIGKAYLEKNRGDAEERDKIRQIEHLISNSWLAHRYRKHFSRRRHRESESVS